MNSIKWLEKYRKYSPQLRATDSLFMANYYLLLKDEKKLNTLAFIAFTYVSKVTFESFFLHRYGFFVQLPCYPNIKIYIRNYTYIAC